MTDTAQVSREMRGYLHDDSIKFANVDHYHRALNSTDIEEEEYWYQSVYHGPDHASKLTLEINQTRRRNNVKIYEEINNVLVTDDETIKSSVRESESQGTSSMITEPEFQVISDDEVSGFIIFLNEITKEITDKEIRILAYYLAKTKLDKLITPALEAVLHEELVAALYEIWNHKEYKSSTFYKILGTRYQADYAKSTLIDTLKEKFQASIY